MELGHGIIRVVPTREAVSKGFRVSIRNLHFSGQLGLEVSASLGAKGWGGEFSRGYLRKQGGWLAGHDTEGLESTQVLRAPIKLPLGEG